MKKRFYETATCAKVDGGYAVQLDGRNIKTPAGTTLVMPTKALAEAVAAEWDIQGDEIDPKSMSLMPLAGTAIDRIPDIRENLIEGLLKYAETDLLCYMADDTQEELAKKQVQTWQPVLDWLAEDLSARLVATRGIVAVEQSTEALEALRIVLQDFDNWVLATMSELVGITGSLVLGLAIVKGHLSVDEALHIARVDEDHQIEQWGYDFEAIQRRDNITKDVHAAYQFYELLKT
ncbi:MAG: ATPase [Rhodospirillaceae bacterium]|nr:MAG: ATPase [Rhodospirillaceae bacterium]